MIESSKARWCRWFSRGGYTESALIERARQGSREAFEMLMKRLLDVIYSYIASHVDPAEYAADILQETMLSAWNGLKNFDSRSSFKTWVFSIARRKIADRYRMYHRNAAARLSELEDVLPLEGEYEHIDTGNDVKAAMAVLDRVEKEIVFLTGRIGEKDGRGSRQLALQDRIRAQHGAGGNAQETHAEARWGGQAQPLAQARHEKK